MGQDEHFSRLQEENHWTLLKKKLYTKYCLSGGSVGNW
jgi:hypothetical protein